MLGEGGGGGEEGQARTGDAQGPRCACPGAHQTCAACRGDSEEAEEDDRFLPKKHSSEDNTGRNRKKSNKKKKVGHKAEKKEENRNNTKKVVGEAGDAKGGEQKSEGDMDVQECDISDQDATPKDRVEWVSGFDYG